MLAYHIHSSITPHQMWGGVIYSHITISFLHILGGTYHIPHNNNAHRLRKIVARDEMVSVVITSFTTMGGIQLDSGSVSHP